MFSDILQIQNNFAKIKDVTFLFYLFDDIYLLSLTKIKVN